MKSLTQIILIFLLTSLMTNINATVWKVNSNAGTDPDFAEVQQAIDAAEPGDIIQIESGIYQGFTINKPLEIIGTCYDMSVHNDIPTPIQPVYINGDVIFDLGSEGSSMSSVNLGQSSSNVLLRVSDIQITRSDFYYLYFQTLKHAGYSGGSETLNSKTTINNVLITNSKIYNITQKKSTFAADTLLVTNCMFSNCIIDEG